MNELCEFPSNQKWELLYRATRDGFSGEDFHRQCDSKTRTLTIIKSTNGNIFGGYTNEAWAKGNQYKLDPNTFLFSLVNKANTPFKINVSLPQYAIYGNASHGPAFGGCHDIYISTNSNANSNSYSNFGHTYQLPNYQSGTTHAQSIFAGSYNFQTVEIEVFVKI